MINILIKYQITVFNYYVDMNLSNVIIKRVDFFQESAVFLQNFKCRKCVQVKIITATPKQYM